MRRLLQSFYPPMSEKDREQDRHISWFLATFTLVLIVTMVAALLFAVSALPTGYDSLAAPNFLTFLGLSLLVGTAGFAVGGFIGFLFGVPRTRTSEGQDQRPHPASQVVSNTNLEQLSDWLTKILVGVGLVQIHQVDPLLASFRDRIDLALTAHGGQPMAGAGFAACLILIGSTVAGFLAAYLKSKTDLMRAFREPLDLVQSALGEVAQKLIVDAARTVLLRPSSQPDAYSRETAAKLVQFVPPDSDDPDLYQLVGLAHAVLKNFKPAAEALRKAVELRRDKGLPADVSLNTLATHALAIAGDADVAQAIGASTLTSDASAADTAENTLATMFAQLYSRGGYDSAIALGEKMAGDASTRRHGRLWLYLACAYGQQHAALVQAHPRDETAIETARGNALAAVREALQIDRVKNGPALQLLWDPAYPGKPASENDLESLYGDKAFETLLLPTPAAAATPAIKAAIAGVVGAAEANASD